MATGGLYGNASESVGLYGNTTNFGGSYFEWFIFYQSDTQPATPTGGSWSFTTNTGTAPTGWSTVPFSAPTLPVWVSIALVNSRSDAALAWSAPGLFSYSSGLPILSGSGAPSAGDGINSQLYIQTSTTPQTIWFKQSGTWNRLVGSTLYADLTSAQTVAGIKTFSSPIVGSVTGTAANVTGIIDIANGGTSSTTASGARTALSAAYNAITISAGTGLTGGGDLTANRTLAIDSSVVTLTGTQTLTNKTLTSPRINEILDTNGNEILGLSPTASATDFLTVKNGIGVGVPLHVYADGPSASIGLHIQPKGTGLVTISDGTDFNKGIRFRSSGSAASAITLLDAVSTAGRVVTLPDATTTLVGRDTTDTLTNKTIAFSSNTFSGTLAIANGGTNASTAASAIENLLPAYAGNGSKGLRLNSGATALEWVADGGGTVTSVGGTGTVNGITLTGTVTTSGNLTLGGTLSLVSPPAIGSTTPNTGAFTTLSASGIASLSRGVYRDIVGGGAMAIYDSAVVASGTNYVIASDGAATSINGTTTVKTRISGNEVASVSSTGLTVTGRISVSGTNPSIQQTVQNAFLDLCGGTTVGVDPSIQIAGSTTGFGDANTVFYNSNTHIFRTSAGSSEYMRISSGYLLVGATSSAGVGSNRLQVGSSGSAAQILAKSATNHIGLYASSGTDSYISYATGAALLIGNGPADGSTFAESARITSTGNFGLGVTPSAWTVSAAVRSLDILSTTSLCDYGGSTILANNSYQTATGWKYRTTAASTRLETDSGIFRFFNAASGTAGNAISFTQALTLTADGNLAVGLTDTSFRVNATVQSGANRDVFAAQISGASNGLTIKWNHATTTTRVNISNLPTSATGLASGDLYVLAGALMVA